MCFNLVCLFVRIVCVVDSCVVSLGGVLGVVVVMICRVEEILLDWVRVVCSFDCCVSLLVRCV